MEHLYSFDILEVSFNNFIFNWNQLILEINIWTFRSTLRLFLYCSISKYNDIYTFLFLKKKSQPEAGKVVQWLLTLAAKTDHLILIS